MTGRNLKKGSFKKEENAVSPVIGVILMVAITVILAAVIGAFVFGMGPSKSAPTVNFRAYSDTAGIITVDVMGGDIVDYSTLNCTVNGGIPSKTSMPDTGTTTAGSSFSLENTTAYSGKCTVTIVDDATNTVILQTDVNVV